MRVLNSLSVAALAFAASALLTQTASAERVCRQDCAGPVCQERCVETDGRSERIEGRGERREERRDERRDERLDVRPRPGIELRAPGVEVEVGR
jgi:hypothetical protein